MSGTAGAERERRKVGAIGTVALVAVMAFGGTLASMTLFEDHYIYFPEAEIAQTPANVGLNYEERRFRTEDGVLLHGWYIPAPESRFTVLHMHGNAGNISHRLPLYRQWQALGLSVFAFDYRGYGKSEGEPSEAGLYRDARAAWQALTAIDGFSPGRTIVAGRSLGAAVATRLAAEVGAAGLALETPFTSIPDMASYHYPWLPLRWLARSRFDTEAMIVEVHKPLLLISAENDQIVPAGMAERILAAAKSPRSHVKLAGGHNDFDLVSSSQYRRAWQVWLQELAAGAGAQ